MTSQQRMAQAFTQEDFDDLKKHAPEVFFLAFQFLNLLSNFLIILF